MLQWGMPQFYNHTFAQMPAFNMFAMPTPFVPQFCSIFTPPAFNMFNPYSLNPFYRPVQQFYKPLDNNFLMASAPKPQGIRSTLSNLYNSAVDTTKKIAKKGYEYAKKGYQSIKNFGQKMVKTARKYLGYNKKDGSYKKFTQGRNEKWCADFVSYVARENGIKGFNFPAVQGILDWGKKNNKFSKTPKVGDAIIFKGVDKKGKRVSHTGVVTSIENGVVKTIEGNTSGKVAERSYSLNDSKITGYVTIA